MSHVATVDIILKDLNAVARAAAQCGLQFNEGKTTYRWFGTWMKDYHAADAAYKNGLPPEQYGKCLHTLSVPGNDQAYEVGIVERPDGKGYTIVFDWYQNGYGLMQHLGIPEVDTKTGKPKEGVIKNANRFRQAYSEQVAQALCRSKGFQVLRSVNPEGKVILRAVR